MPIRMTAAIPLVSALLLVSSAVPAIAADAQADCKGFKFTPEKRYCIADDKVDFGTYNGFRRYHSECHVCHGPAGLGSSYAPALTKSLQALSYRQFVDTVIKGRKGLNEKVMPSFAQNLNVLPYISDIYAYLKARSDGVLGVGRPDHFPKAKSQ
jgi:methanol metabolism-related c-type cytochrome